MQCSRRPTAAVRFLAAGVLLSALAAPLAAQSVAPDYTLTVAARLLPASPWSDPEQSVRQPVAAWGAVRLAASGTSSGNGLSLEAGEKWFARAGLGRSLESGTLSLGGGYRFGGGDALSMQVSRQTGHDGLGLALRYDWQRSYLRLAYEPPFRLTGTPDLRFSAGVRF
jgi:hypothetical protein